MKLLSIDASGKIVEVELTSLFDENRILTGIADECVLTSVMASLREVLIDDFGNVLVGA